MKIYRVELLLCEACIKGEGEMCHTASCILCRHSVDLPIDLELTTIIETFEEVDLL